MSIARGNLKEAGGKILVGGTRTSLGIRCRTSLQYKTKSNKLSRYNNVNDADIWNGGYSSYLGRSHGRVDVNKIKSTDNSCREKSAEAIVDERHELYEETENTEVSQFIEGLNLN